MFEDLHLETVACITPYFSENSRVPIASLIYVILKLMRSNIILLIFQAKLFYYKSANKSALYMPSSSIFLKLSFI